MLLLLLKAMLEMLDAVFNRCILHPIAGIVPDIVS